MRVVVAVLALWLGCGDASGPGDRFDVGPGDAGDDSRDDDGGDRHCSRNRDCGEPIFGAYGPCTYATECALTGARTRLVMAPVCNTDTGLCEFETEAEMDEGFCDRATEARRCEYGGETYCGVASQCKECRSGLCVVNSPNFDGQCNPSCGQAAGMCGEGAAICCPDQVTCPIGTVGPGPWEAACPVCCVQSC